MILSDLRKSILDLSFDEQLVVHQRIRESRLVSKRATTKAAQSRRVEKGKVLKGVNKMEAEELAMLISMLEEI